MHAKNKPKKFDLVLQPVSQRHMQFWHKTKSYAILSLQTSTA